MSTPITEEQQERIAANKSLALERLRQSQEVSLISHTRNSISTSYLEQVPVSATCRDCGTQGAIDDLLKMTFDIVVCKKCKANTKYELISKMTAVSEYLLPESVFKKCKFHTKENPRNKNWTAMKLYLRDTVESQAIALHGSLEALRELRLKKRADKFEKSVEESTFSFASLISKSKLQDPNDTDVEPKAKRKKSTQKSRIMDLVKDFKSST